MEDYHEQLDLLQRHIEARFNEKLIALEEERARVEGDRNKALESLAQLRRSLGANGTSFAAPHHGGQAKTLTEAVHNAIRDFIAGEFDINTVISFVNRHYPQIKQPINPTSVSGILRALRDEDVLELVREGAGPKPAIYKLTENGRAFMNIKNEFVLQLQTGD